MNWTRRSFCLTVPIGFSGCLQHASTLSGGTTDQHHSHYIQISNRRDESHEVLVSYSFDQDEETLGPHRIDAGESWSAVRFDKPGQLVASIDVEGKTVWNTSHQIPDVEKGRVSAALLSLLPDNEIRTTVRVEQ